MYLEMLTRSQKKTTVLLCVNSLVVTNIYIRFKSKKMLRIKINNAKYQIVNISYKRSFRRRME